MYRKQINKILLLVVIAASIAGVAAADELFGKGDWQSLSGESIRGTWSTKLTRKGDGLTGTFSLQGSNTFRGGQVEGTFNGSQIVLGVVTEAGKVASFSGKVEDGAVKGEWESSAVNDSGVWTGSFTPGEK